MSKPAPLAVFIYNRPDHLRRTLASLLKCEGVDDCPIIVFADGPKHDRQNRDVDAARAVARELLGERADYRESEVNKGLAASIIGGVGELLAKHGRVIVIEDDFELAPGFLTYMNNALERYADDQHVCQVSGHMFDVPEFANRNKAVFLPLTTTWGWATWQRAWNHFDPQATDWEQLARDRALRKHFNLGGIYDYTTMLQRQMRGQCDSWGIRWYWSVFRRNGLVLFPPKTLVRNAGMDGTGTHGGGLGRSFDRHQGELPSGPIKLPDEIVAKLEDIEAMRRAIWRQNGGWTGYFIDRAKKAVNSLKSG